MMSATGPSLNLIFRADSQVCALPLARVSEVLRPLPVQPLAGAPAFVRGLSIIRGAPVPVVDLGALLAGKPCRGTRLVMIRAGERRIALAVDAVLGIREIAGPVWNDLPPLVRDACPEAVEAIGVLDQEALLALKTGTLLPDAVWEALARAET